VKCKVVKNKVAPPFRSCVFDIMYNEGISIAGDLLDLGVEKGVISKAGNSYSYGEHKLGVGREAAKSYLRGDRKLMAQLRKEIWKAAQEAEAGADQPKEKAKATA
jgi:recombination protein RecA